MNMTLDGGIAVKEMDMDMPTGLDQSHRQPEATVSEILHYLLAVPTKLTWPL